jgi:hypothetical protein
LKDNDKAKQKLQNVKIKQTSVPSLPLARFQTKQNPPSSPFSPLLSFLLCSHIVSNISVLFELDLKIVSFHVYGNGQEKKD